MNKKYTWTLTNGMHTSFRITGTLEALAWWSKCLKDEHTPSITLVRVDD